MPDKLLGPHPDDFFAAIGRVICLSALMENRLLTLYQAMAGAQSHEHAQLPLSTLLRTAQELTSSMPACPETEKLSAYLARVAHALHRRNDYAHNLWPAQDDGLLFGWRVRRHPSAADPTQDTTISMAQLLDDILGLVAVLIEWPGHFALAPRLGNP